MIPYLWLEEAAQRVAPHIHKTSLAYDPENDLYLKWENHQVTGSFKVRGALNKVLSLQDWEQGAGLVTASAGNHGQGVALAGKLVGAPVIVFASEHATPSKISAMRALGAEVRLVPGGYGEAEQTALAYAASSKATWVSPYNDGQVIAGQGTVGLEILQELPPLPQPTWIVPSGGGGLIAGVGVALKADPTAPGNAPRLVGVQSEASAFLHHIFHHGSQEGTVELPSLADGLSGPVENGSLTVPLVQRYVDDFILVSEAEVAHAIGYAWLRYNERIEGSGATALAAVLSGKVTTRPAVLLITGGNIEPVVFRELIGNKDRE